MAQTSYNIENVYKEIYKINGYFGETKRGGLTIDRTDGLIHRYCHYGNKSGYGKCDNDYQKASSGVINLIQTLNDKDGLEYDKLAEYAILWLRYKLNQKRQTSGIKLNEFYTKYIQTNKHYNDKINNSGSMTYKDIIDTKKDLMDINEISKFYEAFSILFLLYNVNKKNNQDCTNYSNDAKKFAKQFEELNNDPSITENSLYSQILYTLSNDYKNLKNIYHNNKSCDFPSLPELTPQKSITQDIVESPVGNYVKGSGSIFGETPEVTSSSSSISTTLIPALSIVSVIPVFLGIAYKYSLFGIDKLFQRQYIRNKLKKVKKKLKLNI
ncbi:CIR protein PIR protein [Plasmodium vinckei lentum]|uniref:CIR protein PIR protein n=1 Tax=Plasmodium vinckei lentum TaxID=138297 RepID=A0A6V7RWL9_PLAVN|nr:CIR protein PIR protein [Plasmodium vinckei lentum]